MKCPNCGNEDLQEHHRFCSSCGCNLSGIKSSGETLTVSKNSSVQTTSVKSSDTADYQTSAAENTDVQKGNSPGSESLSCDQFSIDTKPCPVSSELTEGGNREDDGFVISNQEDLYVSGSNTASSLPLSNSNENSNEFKGVPEQGTSNDYPTKQGKQMVCADQGHSSTEPHEPYIAGVLEQQDAIDCMLVSETLQVVSTTTITATAESQTEGVPSTSTKRHVQVDDLQTLPRTECAEEDFPHPEANHASKPCDSSKNTTLAASRREVITPNKLDADEEVAAIQRSEGQKEDGESVGEKKSEVNQSQGHVQKGAKQLVGDANVVVKQDGAKVDYTLPLDDNVNSASKFDDDEDKEAIRGVGGKSAKQPELEKEMGGAEGPKDPNDGKTKYPNDDKTKDPNDDKTKDPNDDKRSSSQRVPNGNGSQQTYTNVKGATQIIDIRKVPGQLNDDVLPKNQELNIQRDDAKNGTQQPEGDGHVTVNTVNDKNAGVDTEPGTDIDHSGGNSTAGQSSYAMEGARQKNGESKKPSDGFVTVIFHALMTPTFQFNQSQGDRVFIRYQGYSSWDEENQVAVRIVREVFNGYFELEGSIKMNLQQASRKIQYKYVVERPQGNTSPPKILWECLIGFKPIVSHAHVNRCLDIHEDSLKSNATWHQYDDAVFSEPGLWDSFRSHVPFFRNVDLDPVEGRRMAMMIMLPEWDSISSDEGGISASSALKQINDVVYCMSKPGANGGYFFYRILASFNVREVLFDYLSPRLNVNAQVLHTQAIDDEAQVKRLVTSVIIASLAVLHNMTFLRDNELKDLLENLVLHQNASGQKDCIEFEDLQRHFTKEQQSRTLADSMRRLCRCVIEERYGMFNWLFVVPLLHFLSTSSAPFSSHILTSAPSSAKDNSWWGTEDLDFRRVRRQGSTSSTNTPALLLNQLIPMFELDPLLKRTFLLALPIRDISKVLKKRKFSLYEVCWTLIRIVEDREAPYLSEEEWDSLEDCIKEMNEGAEKYDRVEHFSYCEEMTSLAKAALQLLQHMLARYQLVIRKRDRVLCGLFTLLGNSLVLAKRGSSFEKAPQEAGIYMDIFKGAVASLHGSLEKPLWGSLQHATEVQCREEFQFWSNLLSVKLEDEEIQQCLESGVKELLEIRIGEIDHKRVMELFCTLDLRTCHQEVGDSLMSAAFKAVDHLLKGEIKEEHIAALSPRSESANLAHWQASGVGRLFGLMLKKYWPEGSGGKEPSQEEILRHVFSWKPMAQYFAYFASYKHQCGATLPEYSLVLLASASSLLEDVGRRLRNAEIDVKTLRIVDKNREIFLKLHDLLSDVEEIPSKDVKTETSKMSDVRGNRQETAGSTMKLFLDMRIEELEAFGKERDAVFSFIEMCSVIKSVDVDLDEIKEKMGKDITPCQMLEICHKRGISDEPIVKFFDLSTKNKRMIQSLHLVRSSNLFRTIWQKCFERAGDICKHNPEAGGKLTIDLVQDLVWSKSFERWRTLWERICSGQISLKEVDQRFDRFRKDPESLDAEIEVALILLSAEEDLINTTTLHHRVAQIKQFQNLREFEDAVAAILDFKEAMALEGDFHVLVDFRDQMTDEFRQRLLGTIDDDVLETGRAIGRLAPPMIECLKTVSDNKEYIFWLRKEVKGREEVKTLVDLAMMSAGESDIETDRVSFLHTTALGFAPFIFDLGKCAGLSQLMDICETVWEHIKENDTLPAKLNDISRHLEWLKGVKDAHAMSSLKLAQAINERGIYCIGQLDNLTSFQPYDKKSVDSVISLLLLPTSVNGEAREFSLEKLQELQSKLALISGKNSQGQEDVERFGQLLQGVVQLGQAYVNLCEIGDVSYLDWSHEYKCKSVMRKNIIEDIQLQTKDFERCFSTCKEHINSLRMKYHELNYFTTQQLLFLRKELAGLKHSATMDVLNLQVYTLLERVLPGLHQLILRDVLLDAGICDPMSLPSQEEREDPVHHTADEQDVEKYETLLNNVEKLSYSEPERLAVAALVANWESSNAELVLWCVQNKDNSDLIDELYDKASDDPRFRGIVNQTTGSDLESSQSSYDSDDSDKSLSEDKDDSSISEELQITLDETKGGAYLSLEEMGVFLSSLASNGERAVKRMFPSFLKSGKPNLILARREYVFAAVLGLYMGEGGQSLPNSDEVLICTSETTSEEVELLWRRALANDGGKLHCLVNGDLLDYEVSQKVVDCLHTLMKDYSNNESLALVVLCSSENEERAHIVTSLEQYKVEGMPRYPRADELRRYLGNQFKVPQKKPGLYCDRHVMWSAAAEVGRAENFNVRVVTSDHSGVGKSLVVKRLEEQVTHLRNNRLITEVMREQDDEPPPLCVTIPFHDNHARVADIVGFFLPHALHSDVPLSRIFHLDCFSTVTPEFETLVFNLLIMGELTDDRGRAWRRNPYDLYILEITDPTSKGPEKTTEMCKVHELLPPIRCFLPEETLVFLKGKGAVRRNGSPLFDEEELQSEAVQRVWQYLQLFNEDPRLVQEFYFDPQSKRDDSPEECLETLIRNCGVCNPSWSELRYFVNFLSYQLRDCEESVFCNPSLIGDTLEGFRTFVVAFMVIMSKDFSMRSLKGEDSSRYEESAGTSEERDIVPFQLRRRWERSPHPYIFFNPDHASMTFLGFRVDPDGNLLDPQTEEIIQERLMSRHLRTGLHVQRVDFNNDFESYSKAEKITLLCSVMGIQYGCDPDESYELTGDNVKKILAIHMRFRCNIPVVIMGETGCGKTRLIRYLCGLQTEGEKDVKNMLLMKIHGGTTCKDIEKSVLHAEQMALKNEQHVKKIDTVLFFDEANTTEALGMIKEIMVDRRCNGRPLSDRLKFIVACNPYRRHTDEMIQNLETAGLGYRVRAEETVERLGRIPLRHLVYRVHALPESMRSLVWDFGQLTPEVEELYTRQIVRRYVQLGRLPRDEELVNAIAAVLATSQQFMRNKEDECSFVSLRDVKRAMEVMVWFYEHFDTFDEKKTQEADNEDEDEVEDDAESIEGATLNEERPILKEQRPASIKQRSPRRRPLSELLERFMFKEPDSDLLLPEEQLSDDSQVTLTDDIDPITWSLILALGVCYQARLRDRTEYRETVANSFRHPCRLPGGAERIEREISRCQQTLMAHMDLGPNIACNAALSENVFMMVVCIELRIPLFVVGKPGSSKSLAKTVVADNMQGDNSKSRLFKEFKQIQLVSYQCSPQSTPEGILSTFQQCSELQESKNKERTSDRFASVVVLDEVGLAEDSPKMPLKTLHPLLEDGGQNDDDVIQTEDKFTRVAFIGLSNWALDPAKMNRGIMLCRNEPSDNELEATARGICGGDQDIMPLIEPLISPLVRGYTDLYNKQKNLKKLKDGKKDEFFGLRDFYSLVKMVVHITKERKRRPNWEELEEAIKRNFSGLLEDDFDPVRIIMGHVGFHSEYLQDEEERRGLDCLKLIRASLDRKSVMGEGRYLLIMTENFAALPRVKQLLSEEDLEEPYVIFGSGFPKDQLFTQVCRNINRVKICMETGRTVILLNLENLYESLYDALNQYYVSFGGEKYVDLGLGNHRVKCRVHKEFRLIVIAEKEVVYNRFPIPLINRLEKHFLVMSSGLTEPQEQLAKNLNFWVENFAEVFQPVYEKKKRAFTKGDAFIGYHDDSVPAVVLQICSELHNDGSGLSEEDRQWEENVLKRCQERLLQCATPDSVTRLRSSRLAAHAAELWTTYFREQEHSSLANFLDKALSDVKSRATEGNGKIALRAQISTHSRLLSDRDIPRMAEVVNIPEGCIKCVSLQQFQTEQQFCNCIGRDFWAKLGGRESLLIVQCDSADRNLNLVACSRHLLIEECRELEKELESDSIGSSHILMIVQLARVARGCPDFVGVQGEDWLSVHIDELCPPIEEMLPIEAVMGRSVSTIFKSALHKTEYNLTVGQLLVSCVQEAASRIKDDETTLGRATRRIELLLKLLSSRTKTDEGCFEMALAERLCQLLQEKDQRNENEGKEWLQTEALSRSSQETGTFKKALWRRFQSVVAPILAEVIAYVDRDGNLELAGHADPWVFNLWLKIFRESSLTDLKYEMFMTQEGDVSVVRRKVPVLKSGYRTHSFQCRFPFSWLLKDRIDELCRDARRIAANSHETVTECLRRLLHSSNVIQFVSEAITEGGEESVVACYLYDFAHMVYKPQNEEELEVVQRAITATAKEIHNSIQTPGETFIMDLAMVHVAHSRIQQRLHCLSLLLQAKPDIVPDILSRFSWDENEMTVDAMALQMCLERMELSKEDVEDTSRRQAWCDLVLSVKIPVVETINKSFTGDKARVGENIPLILTQCGCMWQRLSAVRMFIEHVYPSQREMDPQDLQSVLKLWKVLGDRTDFSKTESLIILERFLVSCSDDSIQRLQADKPEDHAKFIHRCNAFFMEIVSVFCFGEDVRNLDPDVFTMLMRCVTGSRSTRETKEFSPFPGFASDSSPVVRSFLLQQLINSSDEKAKKHLEHFLYEAQGLSSEMPHLLNVCLLAVQCMENSCASTLAMCANLELHISIDTVNRFCRDALPIFQEDFTSSDELQVLSLEAIAKARCTLGMTAEFLYMSCVSDDEKWRKEETRKALGSLFATVQALCTSGRSRSPAVFLLKQLVKRYGGHSIVTVSQNEELSWIVPAEFQRREDDGITLDRFLVYGERYREVRDSLARAILSDNTDELIASHEALLDEIPGHVKDIVTLLALYREVAVTQGMCTQSQLNREKFALIKDVILKKDRFLSTTARHLAKDLFQNSRGLGFPYLPVQETPDIETSLLEIVFHLTSVLLCVDFDEMLEPLRGIVLAPHHMLGSFLPTMPEDSFTETRLAMSESGNWYQCPAGHRYFIGDCGRPDQQRDCPYCDSPVAIGGIKHQLVQNNKPVTSDDLSNKGHILGTPQRTLAERDLSPAIVSLLRIILHSAMLAGAYQAPEVVSQLIQPEVQAGDVCGFLWEHLFNDVRNVSTSLERSEDEVLLMIHFILSEILCRSTSRGLDYGKWSTKSGRKEWENEFVNVFVRPVFTNLEERLQNFYAFSVNDRRLGNDPLMREIYEVDSPPHTADIHPGHAAFWKYRTRVTVEHVIRQFQDVKSNMTACRVLGKFLAEEHRLCAVRHLPDILALQRMLTDRFSRRIDRDKANQLTIRQFLDDLPKGQKQNATKLFRSFRAAWDQVRLQLNSQGLFAPTKEQCSKSVEMNNTVSILLPTDDGPGVCCKGLLFFLVNAHNELVQAYHSNVSSNESTRTAGQFSLSEVSVSQLVAYDPEKDLLPLMLANCSYSLEVGKETLLQYNWEALEKQIIDRFIRGRPTVDFKVDNFMFREDARDFSFYKLRAKIPQEPIPGNIRTQILTELKDLRNVCDLLSTLEMAIGFLSTAGGSPEMKISDYFKSVLFLSDETSKLKSKKARQSCSLSHILDLWSTLAVERVNLLLKNGHPDPFDEVSDIFKTEMPRRVIARFSEALKKVNVELFLSTVVEVITFRLAHEEEQTGEMSLSEYLSSYSDCPDLDEIPDDVCVKHLIYAWQLALDVRERDQGRRRSMMS